jgi:hypothetical protein
VLVEHRPELRLTLAHRMNRRGLHNPLNYEIDWAKSRRD